MHVIGSGATYQEKNNLWDWESTISEFLSVAKGVPQSSILGPVLFTIYINNTYADDTVLYYVADSVHIAVKNLQHSFNILQDALKI